MPFKPSLKKVDIAHTHRYVLTWDFEFDITDEELNLEEDALVAPLAGEWSVGLSKDDGSLVVYLCHGPFPASLFGDHVTFSYKLFWLEDSKVAHGIDTARYKGPLPQPIPGTSEAYHGKRYQVLPKKWTRAAENSEGAYVPATHRAYRLLCTLDTMAAQQDNQSAAPVMVARGLAQKISGVHREQLPHNVRLFFPRAHAPGAELWVKAELLSRSSSYFETLLASEVAETTLRRSKRARTTVSTVTIAPDSVEQDLEDSDDETDAFLFSRSPPQLDQSSEADDVSFCQITITQTAFCTYEAILMYIQTGFIQFAPPSSSFPLISKFWKSRDDFFTYKVEHDPSLPLPVSPKSTYRLAHLLQLEDLQQKALDALKSSLVINAAAVELFGKTSIAHDDLRKVVLDFVKENWSAVRVTKSWKEIMQKVENDEIQGGGSVAVAVIRAVASG
ncbi:hypothetical protein JCM11641_004803 [Rhodosporidiobolus odoratus]